MQVDVDDAAVGGDCPWCWEGEGWGSGSGKWMRGAGRKGNRTWGRTSRNYYEVKRKRIRGKRGGGEGWIGRAGGNGRSVR